MRALAEETSPEEKERARWRALELCKWGDKGIPGPLYWLQRHTKTFDEHWQAKGLDSPYQRFPNLPYFPKLFMLFLSARRLFIPKSREMMLTWAVMGYAVWACEFHQKTRVIVQCQKQEKANDLIKGVDAPGYARTLYEQQNDWLRNKCPLANRMEDFSAHRIVWRNGSVLMGVPSGADQVRQYHPTIFIVDEAAHINDFRASYEAADPVCIQIIAVSSAAPSWFGDICEP